MENDKSIKEQFQELRESLQEIQKLIGKAQPVKANFLETIIEDTLTGEQFNFSTKQELLSKAFQFYSDIFSQDDILDKCEKIWIIHLERQKEK